MTWVGNFGDTDHDLIGVVPAAGINRFRNERTECKHRCGQRRSDDPRLGAAGRQRRPDADRGPAGGQSGHRGGRWAATLSDPVALGDTSVTVSDGAFFAGGRSRPDRPGDRRRPVRERHDDHFSPRPRRHVRSGPCQRGPGTHLSARPAWLRAPDAGQRRDGGTAGWTGFRVRMRERG